ncbi:mRNA (guanine-N7)-methyltransferase [Sporobolomyces koalae]|uniref:mRNA (guanine-N7)-methyltransferase n=1 Tax=Sporobolomyces koalae TaxID=500713 RepID=UPI003182A154
MSLQHLLSPPDEQTPSSASRPYAPTKRITPADSVLVPISQSEVAELSRLHNNPLRRGPAAPFGFDSLISSQSASYSSTLPPPSSSLPPKPQSLPAKPVTVSHKRPSESPHERRPPPQQPFTRNQDTSVVANHYNARPNISRETRDHSPILGLKRFNNWIKSVLIAKFARREGEPVELKPRVKVLDLGCGKGGDLQKWSKAGTDEYVGIDLAAGSVQDAQNRWEDMRGRRFPAQFYALDCFEESITTLPLGDMTRLFDVVSMQFCMHYAFETEEKVRCMLDNVSKYLRSGGVVIGTIPDANNLLEKLAEVPEDSPQLAYGNTVYGVKFDTRLPPTEGNWYGHRYTFFLQDAVGEVPEYVVYWDKFLELAGEYGLRYKFCAPFSDIFADESEDPQFAELLSRMKVVDRDGNAEMDEDQLEAAMLYLGFALVKD